ncbi:MAG TPA: ATPase, T2SS/T4P/T4SS family [bacterium]|nr:ATPase, T2SS/T4P/T4SS family [bacterium]HOL47475.1 ATPase, T2SS/T4P/T4SS family [bacterium]HPQ18616.1 ATPase, T2SS/T4P/T4SS family [bacterium]
MENIITEKPIGIEDVLYQSEIITEEQYKEVIELSKKRNKETKEILKELKYATDEQICAALSALTGIPYIKLENYPLTESVVQKIPEKIARKNKLIAVEQYDDGRLLLAIADPYNVTALDDINIMLGYYLETVLAPESEIISAIDKFYVSSEAIEDIVDNISEADVELITDTSAELGVTGEAIEDETPVIKYVNMIIMKALKDRASDIHFEPFENTFRIRERIDGVLIKMPPPPRNLQAGIISRLKIMANLNIAETRLPQDGRIKLKLAGRQIDIRVSCCPTMWGESVVLRILDKNAIMLTMSDLGLIEEVKDNFQKILQCPNGIILVTGPTGCGKTTTLYAGIMELNKPEDKLITVEDPVEYEVKGLMQCQINERAGTTFASALRAILRQDPDIILIGEIRDNETASIAIESALTGHLVLSSTHTNEAAGAITRLIDMGVEPFLLTSTLRCIVAQRLVRIVCPECKKPYKPDDELFYKIGKRPKDYKHLTFYKGVGCDNCAKTGFRGRIGIFELFVPNDELISLILKKAPANVLHKVALKYGMIPMREDGFKKFCDGITTLEEVIRVAPIEAGVAIPKEQWD